MPVSRLSGIDERQDRVNGRRGKHAGSLSLAGRRQDAVLFGGGCRWDLCMNIHVNSHEMIRLGGKPSL